MMDQFAIMMDQFAIKRCAMIENKETKNALLNFEQSHYFKNRLREDRRREPSEGFVYMSTVGWICRREKIRRKNG